MSQVRSSRFVIASAAIALIAVSSISPSVAWAIKCPNVMFVLDRSGSMAEDPNGNAPAPKGTSKWELLQSAVQKILTSWADRLPFGLEMFTSGGFSDTACFVDTRIDVEPAHETATQIVTAVLVSKPDSGTNTGEAIRRAAEDPVMKDKSRGQYIILITDGDPNCNSGDYPNATYTVSQIKEAAKSGIHTFVVGFDGSGGVNPSNLNEMAKAGLEPQVGCDGKMRPCYYSAQSAQALSMALDKIITVVTGGEFGMMTCDDSCFANGCDDGFICLTDELDPKPHCVPDPCHGAQCSGASYCRDGACVQSCKLPCPTGTRCVDGTCAANLCASVKCNPGEVCDQGSGNCVPDPCTGKSCKPPGVCDPQTGACGLDPCRVITCPVHTVCKPGGNCEAFYGDGGVSPPVGDNGGGGKRSGGCDIAPAQDAGLFIGGPLLVLLLIGGVVYGVIRWRRKKPLVIPPPDGSGGDGQP